MSRFRTLPRSAALASTLAIAAALLVPMGASASPEAPIGTSAPLATLELDGTLVEMVSDPADGSSPQTSYSVITEEGATVPVTGSELDGAHSGGSFSGTVSVPASAADGDVSDALAATHGAALPVVDAFVGAPAPRPVGAAAPTTHFIYVAVASAPGQSAPITSQNVTALIAQMSSYWNDQTEGQISQLMISGVKYYTGDPDDWELAANQFGRTQAYFFNNGATHLVIMDAGGGGLASIGADMNTGGIAQSGVSGYNAGPSYNEPVSTLAHELGHNFSLGHANMSNCPEATNKDACTITQEYDDLYSIMGGPDTVVADTLRDLNPQDYYDLGVSGTRIPTYALTYPASSGQTSIMISTPQASSGNRGLRVIEPTTGAEYFVDYRTGAGNDAGSYYLDAGAKVDGVSLGTGVRVMKRDPEYGNATTYMPVAGDSSLNTGQAFVNALGSVTIAVTAVTATTATLGITLAGQTPPPATDIYRFWSPTNQTHFYTASSAERDGIIAAYKPSIWTYEGAAYKAFTVKAPGTVPLYRFYSPVLKGHFYTVSEPEKAGVIANYPKVWTYEGPAYYVYDLQDAPDDSQYVYRFWSPRNQHHFYTASDEEAEFVYYSYPDEIWTYEDPAFAVPTS